MHEFRDFVRKMRDRDSQLKILVVGDAMVDEFYDVEVSRISPEFPIPVNKSTSDYPNKSLPGGAANVAYQFKNFNVDVRLCSFIDDEADRVFRASGLDTSMCTPICKKVPRKRRFYDGDFPLFRWDVESKNYGIEQDDLDRFRRHLLSTAKNSDWKPDVVVFADYDKGVFTDFNDHWMKLDGIKIVDPKNPPAKAWRGCDIFKPNIKEARNMVHAAARNTDSWEELIHELSNALYDETSLTPDIVITDSGNGVYIEYYDPSCAGGMCGARYSTEHYRSARNINVQSVSGAGDCFVAFLAMAVGIGYNTKEASKLAYEAGAFYVQRLHNRPLHPLDLNGKFVDPEDLVHREFNLAFTNGCFDIIHSGHLKTLKFAKEQGEKLVVALNTDLSVKRLKGESRPIKTLSERMDVMASLEFVDYVVSFDEDTPKEVLEIIRPEVLVKAGYSFDDIVGTDVSKKTVIAPMVDGVSTTKLLERS